MTEKWTADVEPFTAHARLDQDAKAVRAALMEVAAPSALELARNRLGEHGIRFGSSGAVPDLVALETFIRAVVRDELAKGR